MIKSHFPYLDKVLSFLVVSSFVLMIAVVILQILARYALPWSPNWTEEMARFCFIYMVSLGAGLAIQDNGYVSVNTLLDRLGLRSRKRLEITILIFVIILMATMFIVSIPLVRIVTLQTSAAMQLNMSIMYGSMTCMGFFVSIYSIFQLFERIKSN